MLQLSKNNLIPSLSIIAIGMATVFSVASLKPNLATPPPQTVVNNPVIANVEQSAPKALPAALISNKTKSLSSMMSQETKAELDTISYGYAKILNELMLDFFTTDFNVETQIKWQQKLSLGTPFLSQLAGFLKLDHLYGIDLFESEAALIDQSYTLYNLDIQLPTFFKFIDHYANEFWPMSLVEQAKSNSHTENLLLNNYDRDFVVTIEQFQLAKTLAPLAPGIERLLTYHLEQIALNGARISRNHLVRDIAHVIDAFKTTIPERIDVFIQYDLLLQQKWQLAAEHLFSSELLNQPDYEFFYDFNALYAPEVLIENVSYTVFQKQSQWWTQFLEFELCLGSAPALQVAVSQRLSLANLCSFNQQISVPEQSKGQVRSHDMVITFWNHILNRNNLDQTYLEQYFEDSPPFSRAQLSLLNSHDILNGLAEANRLRIIRNQNTLKRAEKNYRIWQQFIGLRTSDSLFNYSTLFQWFHQVPEQYSAEINSKLPQHIDKLGSGLQTELAREIMMFISRGILNQQNIQQYSQLIPLMSIEDKYTFEQFIELANWPAIETELNIPKGYEIDKRQLKERAYRMVLESTISQSAQNSTNFEEFLVATKNNLLNFEVSFANSKTALSVSSIFDENGRFHNTYVRELQRIWLKHNPGTATDSNYYDLL